MNDKTYYTIVVAYDGTDFHGWQIQPTDCSITSALQEAWFSMMKTPINLLGASRTDAGVHALGQVARFAAALPSTVDLEQLRHAWNARLPRGIFIRSLVPSDPGFHPCVNVKQKTYYYTLFLKKPLPFVERFGWYYQFMPQVNLATFAQALQCYVGTHDFGSFCKVDSDNPKDTVRTIDAIKLKHFPRWGALIVEIKGPSFVRFQIRRMIGYALDLARRPHLGVDYLQELLKNPNPQQTLIKADAKGLCLRRIIYHHDPKSTAE
ncbi:tRNA pseudouridine(38-40) synthase TruA [bacterium]|nr:tRNA pseudouridine(38-40) synthase TruA [bacterium]